MKVKRGYYDVFVRTCAKRPSNIAVRHYDNGVYQTYTYSELYGVCEYISQNMQQLQCNKGIIGLVSERNVIIPCVIAAAHKCSTTFMFLDPTQDIENFAKEVKFKVVITVNNRGAASSSGLFSRKPDKTVHVFDLDINFYNFEYDSTSHHIHEHSFIAMTSGSTGPPKHIQVPIQCIQPNVDDLTKLFNITPQDIIYFSTPLTFDPSMIEILLACINGASLLIAPEKADILFPNNPTHSITFWQVTPSRFFQFSNANIKNKILSANSTLRILALGGEPLNGVKRLKELKHWENKTKIFTLYGVTEMSCWACAAQLDLNHILSDKEVPLGDCLSETQIMLKPDKDNSHLGKILLVSKTRKCIILNNSLNGTEEENSLRFVDTGDMAEIKNGTIYYRGRKDDVIKRFGHKINLQLIEATIMQCPRIKTCSCVWLPKPRLLVVYFSSETMKSQEVTDFLKCKLDDKHWPDKIVRVSNLPTNPHGKISKLMISQMYENMMNTPQTSSSLRASFLKEVQDMLGLSVIYNDIKNKDFFAIGGTSFLAVAMCNKLSQTCPKFGNLILPHLLSQRQTIEEIMQIAEKEICVTKAKKRTKQSRSDGTIVQTTSSSFKKANLDNIGNPVEFVILWNYNTGKCVDASPVLCPTTWNLYVIVGSHSGKIIVMDAITGVLQGLVSMNARVEASVRCFQPESLPVRAVVGAYDGTIICFTLEDCKEQWKINVGSMIKSRAVCHSNMVYVASYDGKIRCIDRMTGAIREVIDIAEQAISADLVLAKNEFILLGTLSGACVCVHTRSHGVAWRGALASPVFASPVLYDGDKYVVFAEVNGEVHCRTVEKGIKIWKYQGARGNIFSSLHISPVSKFKWQMVFGCHDHHVYSVFIKNYQPTLNWKTELSSPVYSTPCSLNDKLFLSVSNNGKVCAIDAESGGVVAEHTLPHETFSSPAVYGDYIFIGCRDDNLYSLKYVVNL